MPYKNEEIMKYILTMLLLFGCEAPPPATSSTTKTTEHPQGGYSQGFRMGELTKFSVKGTFVKSGKKAKVYYNENIISNPLVQSTDYTIWKIELAGDL